MMTIGRCHLWNLPALSPNLVPQVTFRPTNQGPANESWQSTGVGLKPPLQPQPLELVQSRSVRLRSLTRVLVIALSADRLWRSRILIGVTCPLVLFNYWHHSLFSYFLSEIPSPVFKRRAWTNTRLEFRFTFFLLFLLLFFLFGHGSSLLQHNHLKLNQ
jgi:hypothetical protein